MNCSRLRSSCNVLDGVRLRLDSSRVQSQLGSYGRGVLRWNGCHEECLKRVGQDIPFKVNLADGDTTSPNGRDGCYGDVVIYFLRKSPWLEVWG